MASGSSSGKGALTASSYPPNGDDYDGADMRLVMKPYGHYDMPKWYPTEELPILPTTFKHCRSNELKENGGSIIRITIEGMEIPICDITSMVDKIGQSANFLRHESTANYLYWLDTIVATACQEFFLLERERLSRDISGKTDNTAVKTFFPILRDVCTAASYGPLRHTINSGQVNIPFSSLPVPANQGMAIGRLVNLIITMKRIMLADPLRFANDPQYLHLEEYWSHTIINWTRAFVAVKQYVHRRKASKYNFDKKLRAVKHLEVIVFQASEDVNMPAPMEIDWNPVSSGFTGDSSLSDLMMSDQLHSDPVLQQTENSGHISISNEDNTFLQIQVPGNLLGITTEENATDWKTLTDGDSSAKVIQRMRKKHLRCIEGFSDYLVQDIKPRMTQIPRELDDNAKFQLYSLCELYKRQADASPSPQSIIDTLQCQQPWWGNLVDEPMVSANAKPSPAAIHGLGGLGSFSESQIEDTISLTLTVCRWPFLVVHSTKDWLDRLIANALTIFRLATLPETWDSLVIGGYSKQEAMPTLWLCHHTDVINTYNKIKELVSGLLPWIMGSADDHLAVETKAQTLESFEQLEELMQNLKTHYPDPRILARLVIICSHTTYARRASKPKIDQLYGIAATIKWRLLILEPKFRHGREDSLIRNTRWFKLAHATATNGVIFSNPNAGLQGPIGVSCILELAPGQVLPTGNHNDLNTELLHAKEVAGHVLSFERDHVDLSFFDRRCEESRWQLGPCAAAVRDAMSCLRVKSFQHSAGWYVSNSHPRCVMVELRLSPEQQKIHDNARSGAAAIRTEREREKFLECLALNPHLRKVLAAQEGTAGFWRASNGLIALTNRAKSNRSKRWKPEMRSREVMEAEMKTILDGGLRFFYAAMQGGDTMLWPYPTSTAGWSQWLYCNSPVLSATISLLSQAISMDFDSNYNWAPKQRRVLVVVPDNAIIRLLMVTGLHLAGFDVVSLHQNTSAQKLKEIGTWFTNKLDLCPGVLVTRLKEAERLQGLLLAPVAVNSDAACDMDDDRAGLATACKTGIITQPCSSSSRFLRTLALLPERSDRPSTEEESPNWTCLSCGWSEQLFYSCFAVCELANGEDPEGGILAQVVSYEILKFTYGLGVNRLIDALLSSSTAHRTTEHAQLSSYFSLIGQILLTAILDHTRTLRAEFEKFKEPLIKISLLDFIGSYCVYLKSQQQGDNVFPTCEWIVNSAKSEYIDRSIINEEVLGLLSGDHRHGPQTSRHSYDTGDVDSDDSEDSDGDAGDDEEDDQTGSE
ncbi:hypothetical protein EV127DRAFT_503302 [Xylaria flabelliformis]|nr:hypothetical protein EV127DRAFT_503302 [Xylaria flabelliformis]